ncbi:hypothetical protein CVT25_013569 [Psilocybe cyanescens]|uniref:Uncharacterized protein n=1 Tax=Psilocybe cyanescens TaxID=93625 RepID=A0A409XT28_PSICY|nr:hypothetical protein CVT25_013569 [Psilocybe cyanescens]
MSRSRDFLLPPILQVLESGCWHRQYSEGCSSVIVWVDPYPSKSKTVSKRPQTPLSDLLRTIDLRGGGGESAEGVEHFSHIVLFPDDPSAAHGQEGSNSNTIFQVRRPGTSEGDLNVLFNNNSIKTTFSLLKKVLQKFMPTTRMDRILRNGMRHQGPSN